MKYLPAVMPPLDHLDADVSQKYCLLETLLLKCNATIDYSLTNSQASLDTMEATGIKIFWHI